MELTLFIALVAVAVVGYYMWSKKDAPSDLVQRGQDNPAPAAPYKVETPPAAPAPAKCGCGRSPTGFCVGLHKLSDAEWATHADNPNKAAPAPKAKAPAKPRATPAMKAAPKEKAPAKPRAKSKKAK